MNKVNLGLIVNPIAGTGGAIANKGSDNIKSVAQALAMGGEERAQKRSLQALNALKEHVAPNLAAELNIVTLKGVMGEDVATTAGFNPQIITLDNDSEPERMHSIEAAKKMLELNVDLLLFAGGDGTATDICQAIGSDLAVLGIPCGVKIHSAVYAITPAAAGQVAAQFINGSLLQLSEKEVRDLDEEQFRQGKIKTTYKGTMLVPEHLSFMQNSKSASTLTPELELDEIASFFVDYMDEETRYIIGSGSTLAAIMDKLDLDNTLLGIDVIEDSQLLGSDCTAAELLEFARHSIDNGQQLKIVLTPIGGQGHIIGRGNQQISAELLELVGKNALHIVCDKGKLAQLEGRPLLVDSGSSKVNAMLGGSISVHTGYEEMVLYRVHSV